MHKEKSSDGYDVYNIEKNNTKYYLANNLNYKNDIDKILDNISDLKFDSILIIFGFDTGAYLSHIEEVLCDKNKVIIFEPNEDVFNDNKDFDFDKRVSCILFDEENIYYILHSLITRDNFYNLYVQAFGNYAEIYKEEYDKIIEIIDGLYYSKTGDISLAYRCKEVFMVNAISNLKAIKDSSPLNSYIELNNNVPAIIVSAGPSLDKNLTDMVANIEKVKKCFVIASNRTFSALINKGIIPDAVVSVDPNKVMYTMMENNLDSKVPLVFYEYSNSTLVNNYKGEKIFVASVFKKTIKEINGYSGLLDGGSVAHTCVSFANLLGCSPIILVGQDLAYTYDKHHSDQSTFEIDSTVSDKSFINVDDVFGEKIKTTLTHRIFREALEVHIRLYKDIRNVDFFNASYGADIKGAPHKELTEILNENKFKSKKRALRPNKCIKIDDKDVINSIIEFVDYYILKSKQGIEQCEILASLEEKKSLIDIPDDDIDLQRFLFIFDIVKNFENSIEHMYLQGYFHKFMHSIKRESFSMLAKDYENLTSDMNYQGKVFLQYFTKLNEMLSEVKDIVIKTVTEL